MIPVSVNFEIPEDLIETSLENLKKELNERNIHIEKLTIGEKTRQDLVKNKTIIFVLSKLESLGYHIKFSSLLFLKGNLLIFNLGYLYKTNILYISTDL